MSEDIPDGFALARELDGFMALVGPLFQRQDGDGVIYGFRAADKHTNQGGAVQGGMLMALADHTLGRMVRACNGGAAVATISLNSDFIAGPRQGDWLECRGRISRETRTLVFAKGDISVAGEVVMAATGVWKKLDGD